MRQAAVQFARDYHGMFARRVESEREQLSKNRKIPLWVRADLAEIGEFVGLLDAPPNIFDPSEEEVMIALVQKRCYEWLLEWNAEMDHRCNTMMFHLLPAYGMFRAFHRRAAKILEPLRLCVQS